MRSVQRTALTQPTLDTLANITQQVVGATDPKAKAKSRWESKPEAAFDEVRSALWQMAHGRARCMYCEDSLGTDIDHFWPKATYPGRAFSWPNYLLACSHCNSNLKRNEFPVDATGQPLLLDPSVDDPSAHLLFVSQTGEFAPIGPKGAESIRVFKLNDDTVPRRLPHGRRQALIDLIAALYLYDRVAPTDAAWAAEIRAAACEHPFGAVLVWLVAVSQLPAGPAVLGANIVTLVQRHGVTTWI
jgi:uncharacterized protein (TIGR02646 family)